MGRKDVQWCQVTSEPSIIDRCDDLISLHFLIYFRLKHYAGPVTYETAGFIEKNSDSLCRDLSQAMYRCGHPILKSLFPEGCYNCSLY